MEARHQPHESTLKPGTRTLVVSLLTIALVIFALVSTSGAHDPITTKVRFDKEVIRVLQRNCLGCHHPGGIAMSLATYEEARPWAKAIKEEVLEKRMPPWSPVKGYGEFRNAPSLTQRDVDLLVNWVEGGAPKGDDKDLPAEPLYSTDWQLGKPDLILKHETESPVSADADEYRTFSLLPGLREDRWISAVDFLPGNPMVIHSATVYFQKGEQEAPMGIRQEDSAESTELRNATVLATWMPGQKSVALESGIARVLPAGSRIVIKIHYRGSGEAVKDSSAVGLYFAKSPTRKVVQEILIANDAPTARAGDKHSPIKANVTIQNDTEGIAIRPIAGASSSVQVTAYRPDGSQEVLIWTRGNQFDWSPVYYYKRPVILPRGTRVEVIIYPDYADDNRSAAEPVPASQSAGPRALCSLLVTAEASQNTRNPR